MLPSLLCEITGVAEREAEEEGGDPPSQPTPTGVLLGQVGTQPKLLIVIIIRNIVSHVIRADLPFLMYW